MNKLTQNIIRYIIELAFTVLIFINYGYLLAIFVFFVSLYIEIQNMYLGLRNHRETENHNQIEQLKIEIVSNERRIEKIEKAKKDVQKVTGTGDLFGKEKEP